MKVVLRKEEIIRTDFEEKFNLRYAVVSKSTGQVLGLFAIQSHATQFANLSLRPCDMECEVVEAFTKEDA